MHIPINLSDYKEPTTAPIGRYNLVIAAAEETKTKEKGKPQFRISLGFEEYPQYQNLSHYVGIPGEGDEANKVAFKALLLKRFLGLFKIPLPTNGIDTEKLAMEMVGGKASAEITLSEPDDNGNIYNRLVVPRLKEESGSGPAAGARAAPPKIAAKR